MTYTHLYDLSVDGTVSSSSQGLLVGQASVLPPASADREGLTLMYTGATDSSYTHGAFYRCEGGGEAHSSG